jgi:outer membrane protein
LQLERLNAQKAVGTAKRDMEIATLNLRTYTGTEGEDKIALELPGSSINMEVSADKVLAEAFANRSDAIAFCAALPKLSAMLPKQKAKADW